jgi:hypothetical protein
MSTSETQSNIPLSWNAVRQIDRGLSHPSGSVLVEFCEETGVYTIIGTFKVGRFWNWLHRKFGIGLLLPVKTAKK